MRKINGIVVHCSDSPDDRRVTVDDIRRWHVKDNGWSDIGYHFVIERGGVVKPGRPVEKPGAHVAGHNEDTIGICLEGRNRFDSEQMEALWFLVDDLLLQYGHAETNVCGHRDLDPRKTCPNFDVGATLGPVMCLSLMLTGRPMGHFNIEKEDSIKNDR